MSRAEAPSYKQAEDLKIISPKTITLQNNVKLFWIDKVKDPAVKLEILWDAGTKYESKKLVATMTNKLLLSGSKEKSANELSEQLDYYGAYIKKELDKDHAGISIYALNDQIENVFGVVQQALSSVEFLEDEFQKEIQIAKDKYKVNSQKVKNLSRRAFTASLFGENTAYGQVAKLEDFEVLKKEDLDEFYSQFYFQTPVIFLTGDVSDEFIEMLRTWSVNFREHKKVESHQEFKQIKGRVNVPKKDALQSAIRMGRLMFDKKHEDYFEFQLLNTIFGGYFGSRLMANIREDKGYTYGIGAGMAVLADAGYFFIATEVGSEVKELAVKEIYHEMELLKKNLIPYDELERVKNYMLGEFLRNADGPIAMMEVNKNLYFNELPITYYSDFIRALHKATPESLRDLANKYYVKEEMLEVVAG